MRYFLLLLSLAGAWYCWTSYEKQHGAEDAATPAAQAAQTVQPEEKIRAAENKLAELNALCAQCEAALDEAITRRDDAIEQFISTQAAKEGKPAADEDLPPEPDARLSRERRINLLLNRCEKKAALVDEQSRKLNTLKQNYRDAVYRYEEELRQLDTALDINRIQREERKNTNNDLNFRISEDRITLLKRQKTAQAKLNEVKKKGEKLLKEKELELKKAQDNLIKLREHVDNQVVALRAEQEAEPAENYGVTPPAAESDEEFRKLIAPLDEALTQAHEQWNAAKKQRHAQMRELERIERELANPDAFKQPDRLQWLIGLTAVLFLVSICLFLKRR